jgi:hypothetical protein
MISLTSRASCQGTAFVWLLNTDWSRAAVFGKSKGKLLPKPPDPEPPRARTAPVGDIQVFPEFRNSRPQTLYIVAYIYPLDLFAGPAEGMAAAW